MPLFKVASVLARQRRVTVCGSTLSDCVKKAVTSLSLDRGAVYDAYDDSDGSLILDDEVLMALAEANPTKVSITLVPQGQVWSDGSAAASPLSGAEREITQTNTPTTSASRPSLPGLRQHVAILQTAISSPLQSRSAALARAKRTVIKRIVESLKSMPRSPGDMRYMCEQLRKACPEAFIVTIREDAVGTSFFPFVKCLYNALGYSNCVDNGTPRRRRRNRRTENLEDSDPDEPQVVPLLCVDSNGCAEGMWSPTFSTDEEQEFDAIRQTLKSIYLEENDANETDLVKESFPLQRSHFNEARTKDDWLRVFSDWPILQRAPAFFAHANLLMGKSCCDVWVDSFSDPKMFLKFMASYCEVLERNPSSSDRFAYMTSHIEKSTEASLEQGNRPLKIAIVPLLISYFKEQADHFFLTVAADATLQEVRERAREISHSPLLVVKGLSIYDQTASFTVVVRGQFAVKADNFMEGALIALLSYFVFNIEYPKAIFRTLEFLQRYFLRINPEVQSRKEGRQRTKVNALVASLSSKLASFEASQSRWNI